MSIDINKIPTLKNLPWIFSDGKVDITVNEADDLDYIIEALGCLSLEYKAKVKNDSKQNLRLSADEVLLLLKKSFSYNPETGLFTRISPQRNGKVGYTLGENPVGRALSIRIGGRMYKAARLVWLYMTGEWPEGVIDHKDLNPRNNKWDNLRDVSQQTNSRNIALRKNNKTGYPGVFWEESSKKYIVTIRVAGKLKTIGRFSSKDDAIEARKEAENKYWEPLDKIWNTL